MREEGETITEFFRGSNQSNNLARGGVMQSQLTYKSVTMYPIYRKGEIWLKGRDIGEALGFSRPSLTIRRIYNCNADEFSPTMTDMIPLVTFGGHQSTRIYSLWGCHIIGMIAQSPRAKDFRRWILSLHESLKPFTEISLPEHTPMTIGTRACITAINEANRMIEKECGKVVFSCSNLVGRSLSTVACMQISAALANLKAAECNVSSAMHNRDTLDIVECAIDDD